jgi:hypothetical protein
MQLERFRGRLTQNLAHTPRDPTKAASFYLSRERSVCITNIHGIVESQRYSGLCHIHNRAGLVMQDGMPLVVVDYQEEVS